MPVARLALAGAAAAAVVSLSGCAQPETANDNTNSLGTDRTTAEPTIIRTPVKVDEAPIEIPLPGPTGAAPGEAPDQDPSFSPGPDGEQAETSQRGPDGG